MINIDFEYDGKYLSDYGFIICDFNYTDGANEVNIGSVLTYNKVPMHRGQFYGLTSVQYDECISTTFDICKNPDLYDIKHRVINEDEYITLVKWLNRKSFHKFGLTENFPLCYFNASFNLSKIIVNGELYGVRLVMETDSPFGYGDTVKREMEFTSPNQSFIIKNISQELGCTYPILKIECTQNGNITITNTTAQSTVYLKNCVIGEIIEIDGKTQVIRTSNQSHNIANDFNYEFMPLESGVDDNRNTITATPCKLTILYNPIIKNIEF